LLGKKSLYCKTKNRVFPGSFADEPFIRYTYRVVIRLDVVKSPAFFLNEKTLHIINKLESNSLKVEIVKHRLSV